MNPQPRYFIRCIPAQWLIIDRTDGSRVGEPLHSEDAADTCCQQLNRGIVERQDVTPEGRWTA